MVSTFAAKTEIDQAQAEMDKQSVPRYLPEQRHTCLFNPPHTSSFGGELERQIGTIGRTLDAMLLELGSQQLTHELHDTLDVRSRSNSQRSPDPSYTCRYQ